MKFRELFAGQVLRSRTITIDEASILEFARQFDPQPFHADVGLAKQTRWGGVIASGWHTSSLAMRLFFETVLTDSDCFCSPGVSELHWLLPVRPGDTLQLFVQIDDVSPSPTGKTGVLKNSWSLHNQYGEAVMELKAVALFDLERKQVISSAAGG